MNPPSAHLEFPEPERYELSESPRYRFDFNRRDFVATLGAGLVISVMGPLTVAQQADRSAGQGPRGGTSLSHRLHIGMDGMVTILTTKVEVGQGSRTQLTQAAAEELRLPVDRIRMVMGDTAGPDDGGTAGSRTTPASVPAVRKACAAARELLLELAASANNVDLTTLTVANGQVQGLPSGKTFGYSDLASSKHPDALQRDIGPKTSLAERKNWQVLGTSVPKVNAAEIVTGTHRFPSDIIRPGMLHGKILRPISMGAALTGIELSGAKKQEGIVALQDGDFVGVAAPTSFAAQAALEIASKTAQWKETPQPSSEELFDVLRSKASPRSRPERKGSPEDAFKSSSKVLGRTFNIAYIQHAPMEPRAAVAEWNGDNLTVWTGTQQPSRVRQDLAQSLRISAEKVRVIVPDTGGGFGGKHSGEAAIEAARLAREAKKPVSVRWTREEEFTWAYFRPAGVIDVRGGLDEKGNLVAWEQINLNSGASALATPYAVPNSLAEFKSCEQPLRSGSYRALASTANAFARESVMDELAIAANSGPLEFRLRYLTNERLRGVLIAATERFGWKEQWKPQSLPRPSGVGLACATEKGSYVACCARIEVDLDRHEYRLTEVVEAFECGAIQNPINLKAQVEGCIIQGLGGALFEEIRFKEGRILNASFARYPVPRFKTVPPIETVLLDRQDLPSVGAGETPIIAIAPAIANALHNAVQSRICSLPIRSADWHAV